jgi:hypothetical protein
MSEHELICKAINDIFYKMEEDDYAQGRVKPFDMFKDNVSLIIEIYVADELTEDEQKAIVNDYGRTTAMELLHSSMEDYTDEEMNELLCYKIIEKEIDYDALYEAQEERYLNYLERTGGTDTWKTKVCLD